MLWNRLAQRGPTVETGEVTCEWVDHPGQLSKVLREPDGGLNTYRSRFEVTEPIRMHTTVGNRIDEVEHYRRHRERSGTPPSASGLKILLVGELAYNADRVLALEERGHRLYGLWMPDPYWYNTVGPLPFGHVPTCRAGAGRTPSASSASMSCTGCSTGRPCRSRRRCCGGAATSRSSGTTRRGPSSRRSGATGASSPS